MHEISLKNKLKRNLGIDGVMMKKDSANSPNFTLSFPVPENDLTGRSKIEKEIENFYSDEGFEVRDTEGGQIARDKENNEAYLIGIIRNNQHGQREYNIRIAKTDKPELFYNN